MELLTPENSHASETYLAANAEEIGRDPLHSAPNQSLRQSEDGEVYEDEGASDGPEALEYEPISPPEGFVPLDFLPIVLKPVTTISAAVVYLGLIGGLLALAWRGDVNAAYDVSNVNIYLVARWGPSLIGSLTSIHVTGLMQELRRMVPFIAMADRTDGRRGAAPARSSINAEYFPILKTDSPIGLSFLLVNVLTAPLLGVKAILLQVVQTSHGWHVVVHKWIATALIGYYGFVVVLQIAITVGLWSRQTGLRSDWDPSSQADIIALFHHFNVDVAGVPNWLATKELAGLLRPLRFRLGYWRKAGSREVIYGIRAHGSPAKLDDIPPDESKRDSKTRRVHYPYKYNFTRNLLQPIQVILGCALACVLVYIWGTGIAVKGFHIDANGDMHLGALNGTLNPNLTLEGQYDWLDGSTKDAGNLQLSGLYLRSVPVMVAVMALSIFVYYDIIHRYAQPLLEMYRGPAPAGRTLLLNYLTVSPPGILTLAWEYKHWKVLYFHIMASLRSAFALVPVGVLTMTSFDGVIYGYFSIPLLICTVVLLFLATATCVVVFVSRDRSFPRQGTALIDLWLLCFSSHLAQKAEFGQCGPDWTREDLSATIQLRHDKYQLGISCHTTDGAHRVGFDIAETGRYSDRTEFVQFVRPKLSGRRGREVFAHCSRCADKPGYHEESEEKEHRRRLLDHYEEPHGPPGVR